MKSLLIFIGALAALVAVGWTVSKLTGSHAWYIEDWKYNPGETVLWRDDAADTYLIQKLGQAQVRSFARLHRGTVIVTNQRIIVGTRPLSGNKRMVQYVLYPAPPRGGASQRHDGGLLTVGYQTLVYQPGALQRHAQGNKRYVELMPMAGVPSSTNLAAIRIFTDHPETFRLP